MSSKKESAKTIRFKAAAKKVESLTELLFLLKIPKNECHHLIVGDGSGSSWERGCGWASTLISRVGADKYERKLFRGGMDPGTVSLGEIMAFMQPLLYLAANVSEASFQKVHIVTDSSYVFKVGSGVVRPKLHESLWRQLTSFRAIGLPTTFHWIPRDTVDLNRLADGVAGDARRAVSGVGPEKHLEKLQVDSLSAVNP